jgi:hypothetical protein
MDTVPIKGADQRSCAAANKGQHCERDKYNGGCDADESDRQPVGKSVANQDRRYIRRHHAASRTDEDWRKLFKTRGERGSGDLRLVADLGKKEGDEGCQKRPCAAVAAAVFCCPVWV